MINKFIFKAEDVILKSATVLRVKWTAKSNLNKDLVKV